MGKYVTQTHQSLKIQLLYTKSNRNNIHSLLGILNKCRYYSNSKIIYFWLSVFFPSLIPYMLKLGFEIFDAKSLDFFMRIVDQAMAERETGDKVEIYSIEILITVRQQFQHVEMSFYNIVLDTNLSSYVRHDDVIKWKYFLRCWPFVRGIHWSPVNSPRKCQ